MFILPSNKKKIKKKVKVNTIFTYVIYKRVKIIIPRIGEDVKCFPKGRSWEMINSTEFLGRVVI